MLLALSAGAAQAGPVVIDLSVERGEYLAKARPRNVGLGFLLGALAVGSASAFGYVNAANIRSQLLAQTAPVDFALRQQLVASGELSNALAFSGILLAIATGIVAAICVLVSF